MNITFSSTNVLLIFFLIITNIWVVFITDSFNALRLKPKSNDKLINFNFLKKNNYIFFFKNNIFLFFWFFLSVLYFIFKKDEVIFNNHIVFNNTTLYYIIYLFIINVFCFLLLYRLNVFNLNLNSDVIFSVLNLSLIIGFLYTSNTFLTTFFILEVITFLTLYKFAVNDNFNLVKKLKINNKKTTKFRNKLLKSLFNNLFFQYWSSFFSSLLIAFFIITLYKTLGTTEFNITNLLYRIILFNTLSVNNVDTVMMYIPFIFGILIKLGLTPINFFKIEIYKGLSYVLLFLYSTYYFLAYFLFFSYLITLLGTLNYYIYSILMVLIFFGFIYLVFLIFDGVFIKIFLSYSTFVNSFNFFIILINSLN